VFRVTVVGLLLAAVVASSTAADAASVQPRDRAMLNAALLRDDDLPPNWSDSPNTSSSSTPNLSKFGNQCAQLQRAADRAQHHQVVHGKSSDFKQRDAGSISNGASVFRTAAEARSALTVLARPAVGPCLEKAITETVTKSAAAPGLKYSAVIAELALPPVGDAATAYELVVTGQGKGLAVKLSLDLQLVQVGRVGLTFAFEGPTPLAVNQQPLVHTVVDRIRAAQASG